MARMKCWQKDCKWHWPLATVAALALLVPGAARASCGMLGSPPTVQPAIVTPNLGGNGDGSVNVGAGAAVSAECSATAPSGQNIGALGVSFDGGASYTAITIVAAPAVTGSAAWSVPVPASYPATASVVCQATLLENDTCGATSAPLVLDVQPLPAGNPPVVDSLTASQPSVFLGGSIALTAAAHDPDGDAITYAWAATGGTIAGAGNTATWTATASGTFTVTVTVADSTGQSAVMSIAVEAVWSAAQPPLVPASGGFAPLRIALDAQGSAYVTDHHGTVNVFTARGEPYRTLSVGGYPSGIAVAPGGQIYLADLSAGRVRVLDPAGRLLRSLGRGDGEFQAPVAVAVHPSSGRTYVAESGAARVRVFAEDGTQVGILDCGTGEPAGVAPDAAGVRVYVSDAKFGFVRVYDVAGSQIGTIGTFSVDLIRPSGLTVAPDGKLYVVDAYAGRVAVFDPATGALLAFVGSYGSGPGQLRVPLDVAADFRGRLAVTNSQNARVEIYGLQSFSGVACAGDSDCDGMPDAWELAHGLDPFNAADAWLDPDGDHLLNIEEYWHGTDPLVADSDHDGVSDGDEVLVGGDPLDPTNNVPVADAGSSITTMPTYIVLDGGRSRDPNGDTLVYDWREASGAEAVTLHGADTAAPWFVARTAGDYRFVLRVYDGKVWSRDSDVVVTVLDVPPTADAGPDFGARSGTTVALDGRFSTDANADELTYSWTQVAGTPVTLAGAATARPTFTPSATGLYAFELVVSDGAQASAPARVRVVVDAPGDHAPAALVPNALDASPILAAAGSIITLDGSASVDPDGSPLTYAWTQVEGPPAATVGMDQPLASFFPEAPGVYRFELVVNDGQHDSLPEPVTVVVSGTSTPPLASAGYDRRVRVLDEVALGCGFSFAPSGPITCTFRQVEGVQVPLRVDGKKATFVPIDPGTYVFELQVADARGLGTRSRVAIVADADGRAVPVAAAVSGAAVPGEAVTLDAAPSSDADAGTTLGYCWAQVRGPRLCVDDPQAAALHVTPDLAGYYVFELRADDGALRSPPARVAFAVGDGATTPPVASAGDDVLVQPGTLTSMDGSGSTGATAWSWTQVGGPLGAQLGGTAAAVLPVRPPLSGVTLRFRLGVTAGALVGVPDEACVSVADVPLVLRRVEPSGGAVVVAKAGHPLDGLRADVPAGAFAAPVQLALGEVTRAWYAADGRERLHGAILVGPVGEPLAKPISLVVPIGGEPASKGATASDVQVVVYDEGAEDWRPVAGVSVDVAGGTVTVPVARLGVYQITLTAGLKSAASSPASRSTGCGCGTGSGGGAGAGFAITIALLLLASPLRRPVRASGTPARRDAGGSSAARRLVTRPWTFLLAVALVLLAPPALGSSPPHDSSGIPRTCDSCHKLHNAPGPGLTVNSDGNFNLCQSCHFGRGNVVVGSWTPGLAPSGDEAVPVNAVGSSHNWEAPAFEPKFGTTTPTDPALATRLDPSGKLMCSTCHDQHSQTKKPFDIRAPATAGSAGRHFMSVDDNAAQLCTACHSQWNWSSVGNGAGNYLFAASTPVAATGTAKISGTGVTGTSTNFKSGGIKAGWRIKCAGDAPTAFTVVRTVTSDISLTLASTYPTTTCAAGSGTAWDAAATFSHPSNRPLAGNTFKAPPYDAPLQLTATGGTSSTVTLDGTKLAWAGNSLSASVAPRYVRFTSGANKDLVAKIAGNQTLGGTTTMTLDLTNFPGGLATAPASGVTFELGRVTDTVLGAVTSSTSQLSFSDSSKVGWPNGTVSGLTLTFVSTGSTSSGNLNKTVSIGSLSSGTFTVGSGLLVNPALGDLYRINWPSNNTGISTSYATKTITDSVSRGWATDQLKGLTLRVTTHGAPNAEKGSVATTYGQTDKIAGNGTSTITLTNGISLSSTGSDTYELGPAQVDVIRGTSTSTPSQTALSDSTKSWTSGALVGLSVRFLGANNQGTVGSNNQGVVSTITANTSNSITFTAVASAFTANVNVAYEIDHDGNMTNNLPLAGASATSFTAGNVVCLSCHAAHFADSSSATYDAAPPALGAGDGKLLRRDNDDRFCPSCHAVKIHNSANTSNTYGAWGGDFTCGTCHARAHDTTNLYLVKQQIATPSSGTKTVDFRSTGKITGATVGGIVNGVACGTAGAACGPCEVCHTKTKDSGGASRWRNTGNTEATPHNPGGCTGGCHKHEAGFQGLPSGSGESPGGAACSPCHPDIRKGMDGEVAKTSTHPMPSTSDATFSDDATSWAPAIGYLQSVAVTGRTCVNMCHSDHQHDIAGSTHEWNVYLDAQSQNGTRQNGNAYNSTSTRGNTDFDRTASAGGMCVSCHQTKVDSANAKPAISRTAYIDAAHNTTTTVNGATTYAWSYKMHDNGLFQRNCTKCHSDGIDPAVIVTAATSNVGTVHFSKFPQLLTGNTKPGSPNVVGEFVCYRCHGNGTTGANLTGKDLATQIAKTYGHATNLDTIHDSTLEPPTSGAGNNGRFAGANRHVNCIDCHDSHQAQAGSASGTASFTSGTPSTLTDTTGTKSWTTNQWKGWTVRLTSGTGAGQTSVIYANGSNTLTVMFGTAPPATGNRYVIIPKGIRRPTVSPSPALAAPRIVGAWGVQPTFPTSLPAPPAWNDLAGATAGVTEITGQYQYPTSYGSGYSYTAVTSPTTEAQLCAKCHSGYAYGSSAPVTTLDPKTGTKLPQGDKLNEFNPNNLAHHAVFAQGRNQPMISSATQSSTYNPNWPKFNGCASGCSTTATVTASSQTVTLSSGNWPLAVLPGWFVYIGSATPADGKTGTPPGSAGWYEITAVPQANVLTIDRPCASPSTCSSATTFMLTAGLGSTFVPPFGPWSIIDCSDCHGSNTATDPLGPHGSTNKYMVAGARSPIAILSITGTAITVTNTETPNVCLNCHRSDVYGQSGTYNPTNGSLSRQTHVPDGASQGINPSYTPWGIGCMNCHGGARVGEIHGSNLGAGGGVAGAGLSGIRLLSGASWAAVKRSVGTTPGQCFTKTGGDNVNTCTAGHASKNFATATNYYYDEGR